MLLEQVEYVPTSSRPGGACDAPGHGTEGMSSMRYERTPVEDRLFSRLIEADDLSPNGWAGCWLWPGAKVRGYGQIRLYLPGASKSVSRLTHRVVWEYVMGVIPADLELDHLCRRPACCNPAHLEPVTRLENVRRGLGNQNVGKTHCDRGHPLSGTNLRIEPYGSRRCVQCCREAGRRYKARKRAEREFFAQCFAEQAA